MQTIIQEPTYWGQMFTKSGILAIIIWFIFYLLYGVYVVWGDITRKTVGVVLVICFILTAITIPVSNYFDYSKSKTTYDACFVNEQPKDNTKWVDGECLVKYDGYIEYNKVENK